MEPAVVIVVPPGAPISEGFARARSLLTQGVPVRLAGCGVTYPEEWPAWVHGCDGLSLAELGGYELKSRMAASRQLVEAACRWCDVVFEGVVQGVPGSEVFGSYAAGRLLQGSLDASAVVDGLRSVHPHALIECEDPTWPGHSLLESSPARGSAAPWRLFLPPAVAAAATLSLAQIIVRHVRGRSARQRLGSGPLDAPRLWLGVVPDWYRANKHLLGTLAREAMLRGDQIGVILLANWGVGTRNDTTHAVEGTELWPGLGFLRASVPDRVRVEQAVEPETALGMARAAGTGLLAAARATSRAIRIGPPAGVGTTASTVVGLATLLGHDVLRAAAAAAASKDLLARLPVDAHVVFCAANVPELAAVERSFHQAGIATAEYMHGLGNDAWHGVPETRVSPRFVWTDTDAAGLRPSGQRTITAGLPVPEVRRQVHGHRHLLLVTNYFHRDLNLAGRGAQRAVYQREVLAIPDLLRSHLDWPIQVRWRPHPAAVRELVTEAHQRLNDVELSTPPDFLEDLEWADLLVASHSSTAVEGIFSGIPVFVHLRPELVSSPFTQYAVPERAFTKAEDIVPRIADTFRALRDADLDVLSPEWEAQRRLVGPTRRPVSLYDAVQSWARGSGS